MRFAALFASFIASTTALAVAVERRQDTTPLPPSQDPWYNAPANFSKTAPGTILKIRSVPGLVSAVTNSSAAYQILYRSTDSRYLPTFAVTTLLLPPKNLTSGKNCTEKLLLYQIPYDSADVDASPSYTLYSGGGLLGDSDITEALGRGWIVSTTDYEGKRASFTAGVNSGHATIDSVRAIFQTGLVSRKAKYALWGYSGGALASEWALELAVQYAPELEFAGAALGGLTPNVTSVLYTINGTIYAGIIPAGILGLSSQFPEANAYLQSHLNTKGEFNKTRFDAALNYSLAESIGAFAGQDMGKYFTNGFDAIKSSVAQKVINTDGIMGFHGVPKPPIFAYKAIGDDVSVIADTDALVNRYCSVGATINYQRNTIGNHASESVNGDARAVAFLTSVFGGTYNATGCQISNVTVSA